MWKSSILCRMKFIFQRFSLAKLILNWMKFPLSLWLSIFNQLSTFLPIGITASVIYFSNSIYLCCCHIYLRNKYVCVSVQQNSDQRQKRSQNGSWHSYDQSLGLSVLQSDLGVGCGSSGGVSFSRWNLSLALHPLSPPCIPPCYNDALWYMLCSGWREDDKLDQEREGGRGERASEGER